MVDRKYFVLPVCLTSNVCGKMMWKLTLYDVEQFLRALSASANELWKWFNRNKTSDRNSKPLKLFGAAKQNKYVCYYMRHVVGKNKQRQYTKKRWISLFYYFFLNCNQSQSNRPTAQRLNKVRWFVIFKFAKLSFT